MPGFDLVATTSVSIFHDGFRVGHGVWSLQVLWALNILQDIIMLTATDMRTALQTDGPDIDIADIAADVSECNVFQDFYDRWPEWCDFQDQCLTDLSLSRCPMYYATGTHLKSTLCTNNIGGPPDANAVLTAGMACCQYCASLRLAIKSIKQRGSRLLRTSSNHNKDLTKVNKRSLTSANERHLACQGVLKKRRVSNILSNTKRIVRRLGLSVAELFEEIEGVLLPVATTR